MPDKVSNDGLKALCAAVVHSCEDSDPSVRDKCWYVCLCVYMRVDVYTVHCHETLTMPFYTSVHPYTSTHPHTHQYTHPSIHSSINQSIHYHSETLAAMTGAAKSRGKSAVDSSRTLNTLQQTNSKMFKRVQALVQKAADRADRADREDKEDQGASAPSSPTRSSNKSNNKNTNNKDNETQEKVNPLPKKKKRVTLSEEAGKPRISAGTSANATSSASDAAPAKQASQSPPRAKKRSPVKAKTGESLQVF